MSVSICQIETLIYIKLKSNLIDFLRNGSSLKTYIQHKLAHREDFLV